MQPFNHDGFARRVAPFAAAVLLAYSLVQLQPNPEGALEVVTAAVLIALIAVGVMVAPWERLATAFQAAPPIAFLLVVALLRDSQGGASSPYTPLVILPVFWLGLYGTRKQLAAGVAGVAAVLIVPIVWLGYPADEWKGAVIWIIVAILVGVTVQTFVRELRERAVRLEEASRMDFVTGLRNRRAWEEDLPRELARSRRDGRPVCVAMIDLDGFKAFNDGEGHQAGDRLLKQCAAAWSSKLRATDLMARFGGDEFGVVFSGCALEDALMLIERLQRVMPPGQTVSAGVACWDDLETAESLVARADQALYDSKRAGRDCIVAAR